MIICSNCKHANMTGAMFCAECGAQLIGRDTLITQTIATDKLKKASKPISGELTQPVEGSDAWANLHLLDTGQVLPLSSRNEFTMGRISEGQPIMPDIDLSPYQAYAARNEFTMGRISEGQPIVPDIDLSPYQAYAAGVSRLHAVIKKSGPSVIFMDLGSANGTFLNGVRLSPNTELFINHGDIISLGKMRIQVLIEK